ncbi:unnamed protein product [Echinostoma caproni]|uniref:NR LBD domain-containing protein n=1 Tax=Echinostoma caproni TaxID=27848 RepID=A0A183BCU5_9TREM|nr:unnamed protein product [Echinostoma caproni]
MTCWLVWPFRSDRSPLDKWIIGFICEVFKRTDSDFDRIEMVPSREWKSFMEDQLKLTIQLLVQQNTMDLSVLNVLAFLLLAGNRFARVHRFQLFNGELTKALNFLGCNKSDIYPARKTFLCRISRILQLAVSSLGAFYESHNKCTLRNIQNPSIQLFSQFEDSIPYEKLVERIKVYEWSTLLRWGSRAGDNLRRCWSRWEHCDDEDTSHTPLAMDYEGCFKPVT